MEGFNYYLSQQGLQYSAASRGGGPRSNPLGLSNKHLVLISYGPIKYLMVYRLNNKYTYISVLLSY
jgi:hypothetical protein